MQKHQEARSSIKSTNSSRFTIHHLNNRFTMTAETINYDTSKLDGLVNRIEQAVLAMNNDDFVDRNCRHDNDNDDSEYYDSDDGVSTTTWDDLWTSMNWEENIIEETKLRPCTDDEMSAIHEEEEEEDKKKAHHDDAKERKSRKSKKKDKKEKESKKKKKSKKEKSPITDKTHDASKKDKKCSRKTSKKASASADAQVDDNALAIVEKKVKKVKSKKSSKKESSSSVDHQRKSKKSSKKESESSSSSKKKESSSSKKESKKSKSKLDKKKRSRTSDENDDGCLTTFMLRRDSGSKSGFSSPTRRRPHLQRLPSSNDLSTSAFTLSREKPCRILVENPPERTLPDRSISMDIVACNSSSRHASVTDLPASSLRLVVPPERAIPDRSASMNIVVCNSYEGHSSTSDILNASPIFLNDDCAGSGKGREDLCVSPRSQTRPVFAEASSRSPVAKRTKSAAIMDIVAFNIGSSDTTATSSLSELPTGGSEEEQFIDKLLGGGN